MHPPPWWSEQVQSRISALLQDYASQGPPQSTLWQLAGGLPTCKCSKEGKAKGILGKRVRPGDSCSSSVWYSQKLVGTVEKQDTGELCSAGYEGRRESIKSRASKSILSHSKRGQWKLGARRKYIWTTEVYPADRLHFFRLKNWRAALQELVLFFLCWSSPFQWWHAHFENYIGLESVTLACLAHTCLCVSENLLVYCIMIGVTSAVLLVNAGWRRSHKEHHELIETTFLSVCKERLLPSLLPVSPASPLLPQHHPLPISNSSGRYRC